MEFLRFIKWQWNRFNSDDQIFIVSMSVIVAFIVAAILFDFGFFFSVLSVFGFMATVIVCTSVIRATIKQWRKYTDQMDREKQEVMDKLAGRRTY